METKNREKMLLITVAACVGLWLLNYILINPLITSYSSRQARIKDLKDKISAGGSIMLSAKSIEDQWDRMKTNTLSANGTLTEGQLFKAFQAWSTSSGVVLVSQKPQSKDSDDPAYSNEEIHVDVTGSLTQIFNFLYSVESGPIGLRVDSLELASRDDAGAQLALGLTVSGLILNPDTNSVASNK
jgi:Tfp pilus assembly protein PilO